MPCLRNFCPIDSPGVPGGTTKEAWPLVPSDGSTEATTTWTSAMPPFVAQVLTPLSTQSDPSGTARVRMAPTSEPASGSEAQKAPSLTSFSVPNICGSHSPICSGVPLEARAAAARPVPVIDRPMPAVAPEEFLERHGQRQAALLEPLGGEEVEGVEPYLGRLLDDRPGRLLAFVPFRARGADHVAGERVHPVAYLDHVVTELRAEPRHRAALLEPRRYRW